MQNNVCDKIDDTNQNEFRLMMVYNVVMNILYFRKNDKQNKNKSNTYSYAL